jgi:transposase
MIPCSLNTVGHWIRHWQQSESVEERRRSGRKRKAVEETGAIVAVAKEKKFITPREIRRELELPIYSRTVRRRLDEAGLFGRIARKEHPFSVDHIRKRLSFAEGYANWTDDQWDMVLFSDETHIEMGPHGQVWVQRPLGAAYDPQYMTNQETHPDKISLWGCFSGRGLGDLEVFSSTLDGPLMKTILSTHLLPSSRRLFPTGAWWFQQDNDPKHTSRLVQSWLFNHGVQQLDFPPYSPDLNPIENLWADLKRRVEKRNARDIEQLEHDVREEWSRTSPIFLARLSHNMHKRCQAVVKNQGHKIAY